MTWRGTAAANAVLVCSTASIKGRRESRGSTKSSEKKEYSSAFINSVGVVLFAANKYNSNNH